MDVHCDGDLRSGGARGESLADVDPPAGLRPLGERGAVGQDGEGVRGVLLGVERLAQAVTGVQQPPGVLDLASPTLLENRLCFRLLGVD
ncbi:MAG: hypothetical protein M3R63_08250 [Actinomycetota bacterium]|nr:hypothetical protein [Actinomycetota bacterium]